MSDDRALVERYRHRVLVGPTLHSAGEVRADRDYAEVGRTKRSHEGISAHRHLRRLAAIDANQSYLDEIGELTALTHLHLRWPMRAKDLSPLAGLKDLEVLHFETASGVEEFAPLLDLPKLRVLTIENAPKVTSLEWARPLKDRLSVFGYEGTVNKNQAVEDLAPLEGFAMEAFFCISLTNRSKDISVLETCPNLKLMDGAVLAPWAQYKAIKAAKPATACRWFDPLGWAPSWRDGPSEAERKAALSGA